MRKESKARVANGAVSAAIVVLFFAHGALGSFSMLTGFMSPFAWLVWCGVGLIAVHVVLSVITSREQLTDAEHPASARKKRHLALKWATGALLALAAFAHVMLPKSALVATVAIVVVSAALAVHVCVGAKSLLKDIGIDRKYKLTFRVAVCVLALLFAASVVVVMVR